MATYDCTDSTNSTYGSSSYGTCTTLSVGAPNTGVFERVLSGGTFTVLLALVAAVILVAAIAIVVGRNLKRRNRND